MRKRILQETLKFPAKLSIEVKDLMKKLLEKNQKQRLGVEEIKSHKWCCDVDWDKVL